MLHLKVNVDFVLKTFRITTYSCKLYQKSLSMKQNFGFTKFLGLPLYKDIVSSFIRQDSVLSLLHTCKWVVYWNYIVHLTFSFVCDFVTLILVPLDRLIGNLYSAYIDGAYNVSDFYCCSVSTSYFVGLFFFLLVVYLAQTNAFSC